MQCPLSLMLSALQRQGSKELLMAGGINRNAGSPLHCSCLGGCTHVWGTQGGLLWAVG